MRAKEFINEKVNADILDNRFKHQVKIGEYRYVAETKNNPHYGIVFQINVFDGTERIASTSFTVENDSLVSGFTVVHAKYRGKNIATNMYAYARMLGNTIEPSANQLDDGEKMWRSWNRSGQSKHILPKGYKKNKETDWYKKHQITVT